MPHPARRRVLGSAVVALTAAAALLSSGGVALAHGFTSVVYADVTSPDSGQVRTALELEYDLLVVSAADAEQDDGLFRDGTAAFERGDEDAMAAALEDHSDAVLAYLADRFTVAVAGETCPATPVGEVAMETAEGVPYAVLTLDHTCPAAEEHEVTSTLFADDEGYVRGTKTIVTYDLDLREGSAALDSSTPSFSTHQSTAQRFWEFFRLGAEHLYTGLDHVLFLLALIAGSRRLREVVLAATAFTLAHSVTFVLAAFGVVAVPGGFVEPVIALSIAVVAGWYLWRLLRRGRHATDLEVSGTSHLSLDRSGWARLTVVLCFGLVHGLGFAGALGIDAAWSWTLLWSLLVFNLGIETVQLLIIAAVFPVLVLLRRRAPLLGLWATGLLAAGVASMGLVWFVQRIAVG